MSFLTKTVSDSYGNKQEVPNTRNIIKLILGFFLLIILIANFPLGTIGAGEKGILLRFNAVTGKVYSEGLYVRMPFVERVVKSDIKVQKYEVDAGAASKDLQTVSSTVALNFHVQSDEVANLYQKVGIDFKGRIITPAVQESVKAATAKFTAEELITKRELVRDQIKIILAQKLSPNGLIIDEFNIVNFDFSKSFNEAIEAKVTAEQNALAAKNKLEQTKYEAQQAIEQAKGKAEALQIEGNAISSNPQVVELRALEKWNGVLPQYMTGVTPFINLNK